MEDVSAVLYVYHAAIDDKEFEFSIDVPSTAEAAQQLDAMHRAVTSAVDEASSAVLDSVQPVACVSCSKPAVKLQHNLMYFDEAVPRRVEDIPQPLCSSVRCARDAAVSMKRDLKAASALQHGTNPHLRQSEPKNLSSCAACGTTTEKLLQCSRCKVARYCSQQCQKNHWAQHKPLCIPPQEPSKGQ